MEGHACKVMVVMMIMEIDNKPLWMDSDDHSFNKQYDDD